MGVCYSRDSVTNSPEGASIFSPHGHDSFMGAVWLVGAPDTQNAWFCLPESNQADKRGKRL